MYLHDCIAWKNKNNKKGVVWGNRPPWLRCWCRSGWSSPRPASLWPPWRAASSACWRGRHGGTWPPPSGGRLGPGGPRPQGHRPLEEIRGEEQVCCWRTRLRLTDQTLDQQTLDESASSLAQIKGWLWAFHFLSFILFWPIVLPEVGICKLRLLCASSNTNLASTNKLYNNENISSYSRVIHPYC